MTTRDFDPVLSAALRNELEALADGADRAPVARPLLARPQVWITAITALVLVAATLGVLRITAPRTVQPALPAARALADPLAQITDPDYPDHVDGTVLPLLQQHGTGPATFAMAVPSGVTSVRAYIRCSPAAQFRITIQKWVSAECGPRSQAGFGDIPISTGTVPVAVGVPAGTVWRMVVIVTPGSPMPSGHRAQDVPVGAFPATERSDDTPVGLAAGGPGITRGRLSAPVDELALVTSCRGSGGLVITLGNGLQFGTTGSPLPCSTRGGSNASSAGNDTAAGYRADGRMTWTVRAIGAVRWRAVFSSRTDIRLPYPKVTGDVVARTRGSATPSSGSLGRAVDSLRVIVTCKGTGSLTIGASGSGMSVSSPGGAGAWCDPTRVRRSEVTLTAENGMRRDGVQQYSIEPEGEPLWTVTFVAQR